MCVGVQSHAHVSNETHLSKETYVYGKKCLLSRTCLYERGRELKGIKEYLASERRVPLTEKELGKGSSEYKYVAPLSSAALAKIDTVMTKPEL